MRFQRFSMRLSTHPSTAALRFVIFFIEANKQVDVSSKCTLRYRSCAPGSVFRGNEVTEGDVCKMDSEGRPLDMCKVTATDTNEGYVNLLADPEAFTGYPADQSRKIWTSLYRYICTRDGSFLDEEVDSSLSVASITKKYCSSEPLLYRLVSGLHTSISLHICQKWKRDPSSPSKWKGDPLCYMKRIGSDTYKKRNFYLLLSSVERALLNSINRIENIFNDLPSEQRDTIAKSRKLNQKLVKVMRETKSNYESIDTPKLPDEEYTVLRNNISRIFDCMKCARCKLWGKLQIVGLITTLRILDQNQNKDLNIDTNDLVALVNLANNVFLSSEYINLFENEMNLSSDTYNFSKYALSSAAVLASVGLFLFFKYKPRNNQHLFDESYKRKML